MYVASIYRVYAEALLDILIAGGQLVPGGKVKTIPPSETCVFSADPSSLESLQNHVQVCLLVVVLLNCLCGAVNCSIAATTVDSTLPSLA